MIYLDYNASTPVDPSVRDAMLPYLSEKHGNPSSSHALGRAVREGIETARAQVASLLGASPAEILFTSSGTESNNHVIKGVAHGLKGKGRHIITSAIEHPAITSPCQYLEQDGYEITFAPVDAHGTVDADALIGAIRRDTILVSVMLANNEVGTLQPVAQIAAAARERGVLMHTDAAQAIGKIPVRVDELGVDFLSVAGHKLYAPLGIGALYVRQGAELEPLLHGAGHQGGLRSGTEPVPAIVGLGAAADLVAGSIGDGHLLATRDRLHEGLRQGVGDDAVLLGHPERRLPNTLAIGFRNRIGAEILAACPDVAASTGAACHSTLRKRSAVLAAMDVPEAIAFGAIRFSVGRYTTTAEIDAAIERLTAAVKQVGAI